MALISLVNISKHFGAEQILHDVSFGIERGEHVALVGSNGAGKSTILRIIAGLEEPDSGTLNRTRNTHIAYLPQEPDFRPSDTLHAAVLNVFRDVMEAQDRLRALEGEMANGSLDPALIEEYGRMQALVEHVGYDYRQQVERVLTGLGLDRNLWDVPVSNLSGGQRTRANLARTLLVDADLLLLDEPTNHLDIAAVEWLESYLRDLKRAFLVVAHDRYLLEHVTQRTLELSRRHIVDYAAPYSRFLELRAERLDRQRQEYEAQQQHIANTEDFIRRYGAGQRYKEARGRQKRLDRLERIDRPEESEAVRLRLGKPSRTGDIVLEIEDLSVGFPNLMLVQIPHQIVVRRGDNVAIIGPNGSGKTTLLRTLVGAIPPLAGTIRWGANTSVGYYSQTLAQLDDDRTVIEEIQRTKPLGEEEARSYLGLFLFSGDDVFKRVAVLSGGERSRVALAKLVLEEPNVLVLDEPTNHLDIASRDALQVVLGDFGGTLLFVSHDRYLIDALARELWTIGDGALVRYAGTYSDLAEGRAKPLHRDAAASAGPVQPVLNLNDRLRQLESEAETLTSRLADVGATASLVQLAELTQQLGDIQGNLAEVQFTWLRQTRDQLRAFSG